MEHIWQRGGEKLYIKSLYIKCLCDTCSSWYGALTGLEVINKFKGRKKIVPINICISAKSFYLGLLVAKRVENIVG